MTKPPAIQLTNSTALTTAEANILVPDNISVTIRNGKRTVEGYNYNGEKVVIQTTVFNKSTIENNALRSITMTVCDKQPVAERREEARRMKKDGKISQVEIAKRLGVSQKTISNDLTCNALESIVTKK